MSDADQCALVTNEEAPSLDKVVDVLIWVLSKHEQPSAWDLVSFCSEMAYFRTKTIL
jgi:hypothetical protein